MTKASDNKFPSILFTQQGSNPATPVTSDWRLFFKSDGLYSINSASAVTGPYGTSGTSNLITSSLLLNYVASTDLFDGATITTAWTDVTANQTFTVTNASAVFAISVNGSISIGNNVAVKTATHRINIDSAGTPILKTLGMTKTPAGGYQNCCGGNVIYMTGLTSGSHTIKSQIYATAAVTAYLRASSLPDEEFFNMQVVQLA